MTCMCIDVIKTTIFLFLFNYFIIILALNIIEFITDCVVRYLTRASWSVPRVCSSNEDKIRTSRLYTVKCETAQIIWKGKRKSERGRETDRQTGCTQWSVRLHRSSGRGKENQREGEKQTDRQHSERKRERERERERESAHLIAHIRVLIAQRHIIKNHESIMHSVYQCNQIFSSTCKIWFVFTESVFN